MEKQASRGTIVYGWWRSLQPYDEKGKVNPRGDRATLARLRHAPTPEDALTEPQVVNVLYKKLYPTAGFHEERLTWVAVLAMVLAHVRENKLGQPARAVGADGDNPAGETAIMKPLRFKRLLLSREPDDVARQMRRLVQLAEGKIDVGSLAEAILDWHHEKKGPLVRMRWTFEYYNARPPKADDVEPSATA